jgi:hypothetical protein
VFCPPGDAAVEGTVNRRFVRYLWASPNTFLGLLCIPLAFVSGGRLAIVDGVLELHGGLISLLIRCCTLLLNGASAMTLGHVVIGRDGPSLDRTRPHERVHVRQCEVWGPAFLPAYLVAGCWGWLKGEGAYKGNYFERRALQSEARH